VTVKFEWNINTNPDQRDAVVRFNPVDQDVTLAVRDDLKVSQKAAEAIEIGVKGDSLAIIAIHQALGSWTELDTSEKMEFWEGVELWTSGENKGRVKRAEFFMFNTKEGLPFQVKYLTAAEELYFFGNTNTFLLDINPGEHICELENLRKLTIGAYGLSTLPESFKKLKNLEYLDISSNNFQSVPAVLTPENFPKLTALILNSCTRNTIYDLSNTIKTNFGGLFEESDVDEHGNKTFPKRLLMWDNLDTLRLSVNYLEGIIPDFENDPDFPKWTEEEVNACDTLPSILIGMPKILPDTDFFAINLNRLHGMLPDWLLYHPKLDQWYPTSLVFMQEGKTSYGTSAGFSNEPANMDYYYEHYTKKKFNPANLKSE
jgi:Leucine-rich repeat (LRR) protein